MKGKIMVVDIDNGEPTSVEDRRFDQDPRLLAEYPEMAALSGLVVPAAPYDELDPTSQDALSVSAAFLNGITGEHFTDNVAAGKFNTGSAEYLLQVTGESLDHLAARNNPAYQRFIDSEREKLEARKAKAVQVIGNRQRINGVYQ